MRQKGRGSEFADAAASEMHDLRSCQRKPRLDFTLRERMLAAGDQQQIVLDEQLTFEPRIGGWGGTDDHVEPPLAEAA